MATYIVIDLDDTAKVDYSQVNTTSAQTMRRNVANSQGMISYDVEPSYITNGRLVPVSTLNHAEALALLQTPEWTPEEPSE
tara:strand:+ start:309 stop:551 length:243 start_codon:yes stop_codon:yes gene_type:complete